ncbi:WD40 repeat domain-containing serine/threonine protein kinase [Streptomyces eurythermus]|uniref:WD40 repeat domain-containing serine/threonine protein kinase n=1 Tax=Streptomyces eurythermus TaxID=42237 RepID=UPI0033F4B9F3
MTGTDSLPTGHRLVAGRYRLTRVLGRGGMGVVWQATDELIGRGVAVKELRAPHGLSAGERTVFGERALREARTAGRINHPGVVSIHDVVPATAEDDAVYIVMEWVRAPSLADILRQHGALSEQRVAAIGARVLEALHAAHAIGLVHRDVKPSNILVLPGDEVKLVDFGIAHAVDDTRLTRHGVAGSTGHIAPELFEGEPPSPAGDLWALGVTLCHAVTGRSPFERESTAATIHAILFDDPPSLDDRPLIAPVINGLLQREPERRMSGQQAAAGLRAATNPTTMPAPAPAPASDPATTPAPANAPAPATTRAPAQASAQAPAPDPAVTPDPGATREPAPPRRNTSSRTTTGARAGWEDRPTTLGRDPGTLRRSRAGTGDPDDDPAATGPTSYPLTPVPRILIVNALCAGGALVLAYFLAFRLSDIWQLNSAVTTISTLAPFAVMLASFAVIGSARWEQVTLGPGGVILSRRKGGSSGATNGCRVEWAHIDEVVVVRKGRRTIVHLRMAAHTPADVRSKPPFRGFARLKGGSPFVQTLGVIPARTEEVEAAFRVAAPREVTVRFPAEPTLEDSRSHGTRRIGPPLLVLLMAGILVSTYVFHHDPDVTRLTEDDWGGGIEFSPDGRTLASGTSHDAITLWDLTTHKAVATLRGHGEDINALRFNPSGTLLASASDDDTVKVWDMSTHQARRTLTMGEDVSAVWLTFSPDNQTLAGVTDEQSIVLWNARTGRRTATLTAEGDPSDISAAVFSSDGRTVSVMDDTFAVHHWDVRTGRSVSKAGKDVGRWVSFSGSSGTVRDGSGAYVRSLYGHSDQITGAAWGGAGRRLFATCSDDHTVRVWRTDSGDTAAKLSLNYDIGYTANAVALSADGTTLAYGSGTQLWLWSTGIGS